LSTLQQPCVLYGVRLSTLQQPCVLYGVRLSTLQQPCVSYGVRLSTLQQPCVSYDASYNFQYTVACPSRFSYLIKDEKYHGHSYS
jgi:hypothetical protein